MSPTCLEYQDPHALQEEVEPGVKKVSRKWYYVAEKG